MTTDLQVQLVPDGAVNVLPPYGFVHLQASMCSDLDVVNAARVSFAKQSDWEHVYSDTGEEDPVFKLSPDPDREMVQRLRDEDEKVLRFLLKNRHGTPFEHGFMKFHVRAPIFVFREWHRHRIGWSYNEESARYSPLQPHFYLPHRDSIREQKGKPGRYVYERVESDLMATAVIDALETAYTTSYSIYQRMIDNGIAKEVARTVLPVGIYSQMIATCNARSLMNFLRLRNAPTALHEIRVYAEAMENIFAELMPVTHAAFVENDRVAP